MANCVIISGGTWNPDIWPKVKRYLGPYRVATALEEAGYSTFVLDYIEQFTPQETAEILSKHIGPETLWFGFSSTFFWNKQNKFKRHATTSNDDLNSMYYTEYEDIKYVLNLVKFLAPKAKIIYGGSKAPYFASNDVDKNIDYYVTGNADNSIIDITNCLASNKTIKHLSGKQIDSFKYPEPDVNNLTTRWWNFPVIKGEGLPMELARGCIFKCKFCDYPLTGKRKGTYLRDPQQIKDEMIKNWETHGTESYFFTDDTFNDDNDKLEELAKVFKDLPFDLKFSAFLRLDLINRFPHQAKLLLDMGLIGNFFGIESLNQKSATAVGKGLRIEKTKERLYWLKEQWGNRVNIEAGFILGLPYDTEQYFKELIEWCTAKDNPIDAVRFYPLMLFHYKDNPELHRYASEFALNPEIYGYKVNNVCKWELPEQKLNYEICLEYSKEFNDIIMQRNKIAGFGVITALNTGISLEDIRNLTENDIQKKYDISSMNTSKFNQYKRLVK